jgi:hypothetical protein
VAVAGPLSSESFLLRRKRIRKMTVTTRRMMKARQPMTMPTIIPTSSCEGPVEM